jgi:phosphomannomutase
MDDRRVPDFGDCVEKVGYMDGCKVYFRDGSFVSCRFSGTEPLLRFIAEAPSEEKARGYVSAFEDLVETIIAE